MTEHLGTILKNEQFRMLLAPLDMTDKQGHDIDENHNHIIPRRFSPLAELAAYDRNMLRLAGTSGHIPDLRKSDATYQSSWTAL